jgi:hypothetical protein
MMPRHRHIPESTAVLLHRTDHENAAIAHVTAITALRILLRDDVWLDYQHG